MIFDTEQVVERVAALPSVQEAVHSAQELMGLWPLTGALQLDNDAKYAENLQVRMTRFAAEVMTRTRISAADAEYVYEGADSIPGREQEIVDALLNANDAYESVVPEDGAIALPTAQSTAQCADALNAQWNEHTLAQITATLNDCTTYVNEYETHTHPTLAWRFAVGLVVLELMMRATRNQLIAQLGSVTPHTGGIPADRADELEQIALPTVFIAQAMCEAMGLPPISMTSAQWHGIIDAYATGNGDSDAADSAVVLAEVIAPLASAEWRKHREEVLWDPAEAKKRAKEEDDRKNKEALAAKFAHIKDDPTKPQVEL